jgi:hypothetical protein
MRYQRTCDPLDLPCWPWGRAKDAQGYGGTSADGTYKGAHCYVYERLIGPIPDGLELDHLCRNPACVNPDHLEPVTHAENMRRGTVPWKLNAEKAAVIRREHARGVSKRLLAARYGVSSEAIRLVVNGVTWRTDNP